MATNINLPASLSHLMPDVDGFSRTKGSENIEINTISGETQTRKRNISQNDIINLSYTMTTSELNDFRNFYQTTLESGTKTFNITDPVFATTAEVKIINQEDSAYSITYIAQDAYRVSLVLEVL